MREEEAHIAADILGLAQIEFWHEPDGKLRVTQHLVERLCAKLGDWQPETIYVTHDREMLADHCAAARLVKRALSGRCSVDDKLSVLMFEVWTPLQQMDQIVDISPYVEDKVAAIRSYRSQCDAMRFDEAAIALNRYRGEMHSWPGGNYAEIFKQLQL